ncbi:MAG: T9SS type A sorting domain-containing protein [Bacteroidetes bacterium]|nr:T9SS type A sorting domain-containing protein [Bacteroidota bacterium]
MKAVSIFILLTLSISSYAQTNSGSQIFTSTKAVSINMSTPDTSWEFGVFEEAPKHGHRIDELKRELDAKRTWAPNTSKNVANKKTSDAPELKRNFQGPFNNGTPNDNSIAISNDGIIVAAVNSNVRMTDSDGKTLLVRTLASIAKDLGTLDRAFDPHLFYDWEEDRFILIFLNGSKSDNTSLIVGFSASNDPTKDWNFYRLPGNVHGNNTWSDYPFMAVNKYELFIPVLLWLNGESGWDSEAQELIWQIDKMKGYAGEELEYKYYDSLKVANRLVWNTRPVPGSKNHYGPNMYLVANRAIDAENDSFFLFEITNTLASGKAEIKTRIAKANVPYGIPPSAHQPKEDDPLRTNYADVHGAFYHNGLIHFVANSNAKTTNSPGIYYGVMRNLQSDNPTVLAKILSADTLDFNYPNIAYAGDFGPDRTCMINFLHSSASTYPGSSAVMVDRNGDFTNVLRVKEGEGHMNVMDASDLERWGDYTGIQRKYNEPGVVWMAGSYGNSQNRPTTWIAELKNTDPLLSIPKIETSGFEIFPNPAREMISISIENPKDQQVEFSVINHLGQEVKRLSNGYLSAGQKTVSFNVAALIPGQYHLVLRSNSGIQTRSFLVE